MSASSTAAHSVSIAPLLADSLAVWRIEAEVLTGESPGSAEIRMPSGYALSIERAGPSQRPVRWWLRWQEDTSVGGSAVRRMPCASVVSLLRAVRGRLEAAPGAAA